MNKKKYLLLIQKNKINDLFFITYVIVFEKYNKNKHVGGSIEKWNCKNNFGSKLKILFY